MLNYIWAGLIGFSLLFAMVYDARDLARDTYRNDQPLAVSVEFPDGYRADARSQRVRVSLVDASTHYGIALDAPAAMSGTLIQVTEGRELRFGGGLSLPAPLGTISESISPRDGDLRGPLVAFDVGANGLASASVRFAPVRFVKMQAISAAAFGMAETAVSIALGLIGVIALWMGLLKIAEVSGLLHVVVRLTQPVLRPLFPEIPKGHPAFGMIVLNLTANMLGLGNAATPLGIKAMEELQTLNPDPDTATNSMVMLLAMNTASVQLVPPVLLVAIMGLQINQLIFAIIIVTSISLVTAVIAARLLSRMKRYRLTDPTA